MQYAISMQYDAMRNAVKCAGKTVRQSNLCRAHILQIMYHKSQNRQYCGMYYP